MSLGILPVPLIEHILSFVDDKTCTRQSRATLVKEVLSTCNALNNTDKRNCIESVLRRHVETCRQCTISFLNFRYKKSGKKLYFKFNMHIGYPPDYGWYTENLHDFCIILNSDILSEVADKKDAFSPEEYESTGELGEELGYARLPTHEEYHYPAMTTGKTVQFSCLLYLTRLKAIYDDIPDSKKEKLEERAGRIQQKIEEKFNEQTIIHKLADYLKTKMCETKFADCSYTINANILRMQGFHI